MSDPLVVPASVYDAMVVHSEEALPQEAVGLLGGEVDGRVACAIRLENIGPPGTFLADPYSQYQAERQIRQSGLVPLAVYHSHPGGGTGLSDLDRLFAAHVPLIQVVLALDRPHRPGVEARAFRISEHGEEEVDLIVNSW